MEKAAGGEKGDKVIRGMLPEESEILKGLVGSDKESFWFFTELGIPLDIISILYLQRGSDWEFIITLHALLETGINYILIESFKKPELARTFSRLETSNPRTGKIAFLKACKTYGKWAYSFITQLSEIRNWIVHDINNFSFKLSDHISKLDEKQYKSWIEALSGGFRDSAHGRTIAKENPRVAMITCTFAIVRGGYFEGAQRTGENR